MEPNEIKWELTRHDAGFLVLLLEKELQIFHSFTG